MKTFWYGKLEAYVNERTWVRYGWKWLWVEPTRVEMRLWNAGL